MNTNEDRHTRGARDAEISLRGATPADALSIAVLGSQIFLETYAPDGIRPALAREVSQALSREAIESEMMRAETFFVVAELGAHMVGFGQCTTGSTHPLTTPLPAVQLDRLYVLSGFIGNGLGSRLLYSIEAHARREGAALLWAKAWAGNTRALAFYERRGFIDRGPTDYVLENETYPNRLLEKVL